MDEEFRKTQLPDVEEDMGTLASLDCVSNAEGAGGGVLEEVRRVAVSHSRLVRLD